MKGLSLVEGLRPPTVEGERGRFNFWISGGDASTQLVIRIWVGLLRMIRIGRIGPVQNPVPLFEKSKSVTCSDQPTCVSTEVEPTSVFGFPTDFG